MESFVPSCPIVGLTGGIGSGKSTAAAYFSRLGIPVIDTDAIAHQLTAEGHAALQGIVATFGPDALTSTGALNRTWMRNKVFADAVCRKELEAILHPLIWESCQHALQETQAQAPPYIILMVPLLFETEPYMSLLTRSIVVDCAEEAQIERVIQRGPLSREAVLDIMATQLPRQVRCRQADDIIENDGSLANLDAQVKALHHTYLNLFG